MLGGGQTCNAQDTIPDYECVIDIPNFFTPNGDGINDKWIIYGIDYYISAEISIVDRNGMVVYKYRGIFDYWDGNNYEGVEMPNGVYFYYIDLRVDFCLNSAGEPVSNKQRRYSGSVRLIRDS